MQRLELILVPGKVAGNKKKKAVCDDIVSSLKGEMME
jgi:hypothetical protein